MIVLLDPIRIFNKDRRFNLNPCLKKVLISEVDNSALNKGKSDTEVSYEFEIYCPVDQRAVIENKITDVVAFLSPNSLEYYNSSIPSVVNSIDINKSNLYNDVVYDILHIKEKQTNELFNDLTFFAKFNLSQNYNKTIVKPENIKKLSDEVAFGYTTKFKAVRSKKSKVRKVNNYESRVDILRSMGEIPEPSNIIGSYTHNSENLENSKKAFQREYLNLVNSGIDPLHFFEQGTKKQSIGEFLKGIKSINTDLHKNSKIRKAFQNITQKEIKKGSFSSNYDLKKIRVSNRISLLKTKIRKSRSKLLQLSRSNSHVILFAYNKSGIKIDSFSYPINLEPITKVSSRDIYDNPIAKICAVSSRNRQGKVNSRIRIQEKCNRKIKLNVYTKVIKNFIPSYKSNFAKTCEVDLQKYKTINLVDGVTSKNDFSGALSTSSPVFHRYNTYDYRFRLNISNTYCSFAAPKTRTKKPNCVFYAISQPSNGPNSDKVKIFFKNVSENVKKIRILKRVVTTGSQRGLKQEYKHIKDVNFKDVKDIILGQNPNQEITPVLDYDLENNTTYEYKVVLFENSGSYHELGKTFIYKYIKPTRAVRLSIIDSNPTDIDIGPEDMTKTKKNVFTVKFSTDQAPVSKILTNVFGDSFELFKDAFKNVSSSADLLYGVNVTKVNTDNGQVESVGQFQAKYSEDKQALSALVYDEVSILSNYIYEFHPYVALPKTILSRIQSSAENFRSLGIITNNSTQANIDIQRAQQTRQLQNLNAPRNPRTNRPRVVISTSGNVSRDFRTGRSSSPKVLLEHNGNNIFDEGSTGDIQTLTAYSSFDDLFEYDKLNNIRGYVRKIEYYSQSSNNVTSVNNIQKSFYKVGVLSNKFDYIIDFYVILKRENKMAFTIEGAIHSHDNLESFKSYEYLSECNGSYGLIEYFAVPILKTGKIIKPVFLGRYIQNY